MTPALVVRTLLWVTAAVAVAAPGCASEADQPSQLGAVVPGAGASGPTVPTPGADPSGTSASAGTPVGLDQLASSSVVVPLVPEVVASVPHDPAAYTQGLEEHDGLLLESVGRYGESDRRRVDPATGKVLTSVPLPDEHFGEGLTVVGDDVMQLTWREGVAHLADVDTLEGTGELDYEGEGWGLCHDGQRLVMSDGSATLRFRHARTFDEIGQVEVTLEGHPVPALNELECADGLVWANVYQTTAIVAVEPDTGRVVATVDASGLVPPGLDQDAVLNGIARRPGGDTFWITGKLWPVLYEVRLARAS